MGIEEGTSDVCVAHNDRNDRNKTQQYKAMMRYPITELARFIAWNWFGTTEELSAISGVSVSIIVSALSGKKLAWYYEKRIREALINDNDKRIKCQGC